MFRIQLSLDSSRNDYGFFNLRVGNQDMSDWIYENNEHCNLYVVELNNIPNYYIPCSIDSYGIVKPKIKATAMSFGFFLIHIKDIGLAMIFKLKFYEIID